jgi:hypothetical protein
VRLLAMEKVAPRTAHEEQRTVTDFLRRICARLDGDGALLDQVDSQHDSPWGRFGSVRSASPLRKDNWTRWAC